MKACNFATSVLGSALLIGGTAATGSATTSTTSIGAEGSGFQAFIEMTLDATLAGNTELIGVHLHTGGSTVNGPINIIYCMNDPLPNGPWPSCATLESETTTSSAGVFTGKFIANDSYGAWPDPNNATAVPGAATLAEGAATTYQSFMQELLRCTDLDCNVYFNWHTLFSFQMNPGYGLGRAQLAPLPSCPSTVTGGDYLCFGTQGTVNSMNTNQVTGMTNPLPQSAGSAKVLIVVPKSTTIGSSAGFRGLRGNQ